MADSGGTKRVIRILGAGWKRLIEALMTIVASLSPGARSGDPQARKMYEHRDKDYRP
jgi:hypothetical protein